MPSFLLLGPGRIEDLPNDGVDSSKLIRMIKGLIKMFGLLSHALLLPSQPLPFLRFVLTFLNWDLLLNIVEADQ